MPPIPISAASISAPLGKTIYPIPYAALVQGRASVIVSVTYDHLCQIRAHSLCPQQAKPWGHRRRQANGFSFIETVRHWVC
jgi:hypothetical protein